MERLDFCSVTGIIREYCNEEKLGAQLNFVEKIFYSCVYGEEEDTIYFDETQVCRWLKGQVNISRTIISYYINSTKHQQALREDIKNGIVSILYDKEMALDKLKQLLLNDTTISGSKKEALLEHYGIGSDEMIAAFIADLLLFSMERRFIKRDSDKNLIAAAEYSPIIADYIFENDTPSPCRFFCGRDNELSALHELLTKKGKLFLYGLAGIGKSELAKAYAKKYKKEYNNILYIIYTGSLNADIAGLDFADDLPGESLEERFKKHNRFLRSLKDDSLIIIDNYDTTTQKDTFLPVLMKYRCRILFTTRSSFYDYEKYELNEITDRETLMSLVSDFYEYDESERDIISQIIDVVHSHTFTVELAARLLNTGILTPAKLLDKLKAENVKLSSTDTIGIKKDGAVHKDSYYGHIHTLFSLSSLDDDQTSVMRYMSFVPLDGMNRRLFAGWTCQDDMNTINSLIELGYIKELTLNRICLHPMVKEITVADTIPSVSACIKMLTYIQENILTMHGIDVPYPELLSVFITNVMDLIVKDDSSFFLRFIEDAFTYLDDYHNEQLMRRIVDEMDELLESDDTGTVSDRALLYDFKANIKETFEDDISEAIELEKKALELLPDISADTALLHSNINANYGSLMQKTGNLSDAVSYMEKGIEILRVYHLEHMNQMVVQICNYSAVVSDMGDPQKALSLLRNCQKLVKSFNSDVCHDNAMLEESISMIYLMTGRIDEATLHRKKALKIYETIWADQPLLIQQKQEEIRQDYLKAGLSLGALITDVLKEI